MVSSDILMFWYIYLIIMINLEHTWTPYPQTQAIQEWIAWVWGNGWAEHGAQTHTTYMDPESMPQIDKSVFF